MSVLFGTTQGRLVPSITGHLQCFPQRDWRRELSCIHQAGLDYVEWLVERQHNPDNPIWSDEGLAAIAGAMAEAKLRPYSAINDYLLDVPITSEDALDQHLRLVDRASRLELEMLVLPLLEASEPAAPRDAALVEAIQRAADAGAKHGIRTCLETVMPAPQLLELLDAVGRDSVRACFDTGNRAASGLDIYGDMRMLGDAIVHMHVKDKMRDGTNVLLGTGLVNFHEVAKALAEIGYAGTYTFETTRGVDPLVTATWHRQTLEFFLFEAGAPGRSGNHEEP